MHTWWHLVCDEHKEFVNGLVVCCARLKRSLPGEDVLIHSFLEQHYSCKIRMIHSDNDLDELYDAGYKNLNRMTLQDKIAYCKEHEAAQSRDPAYPNDVDYPLPNETTEIIGNGKQ